jgi:hypothetical protein
LTVHLTQNLIDSPDIPLLADRQRQLCHCFVVGRLRYDDGIILAGRRPVLFEFGAHLAKALSRIVET